MSLNKVILIGRVGKDPKTETTQGGTKVSKFSLATSERWTNKQTGEKQEKTEWHNIVIWNDGLIGVVEKFVAKGSQIYLEGQLQTRKWEKDGVERYTTEIVLQKFRGEIQLLDNRKGDGGGSNEGGSSKPSGQSADRRPPTDLDDEIPF